MVIESHQMSHFHNEIIALTLCSIIMWCWQHFNESYKVFLWAFHQKPSHYDINVVINGGTAVCHNNNIQCHQRQKCIIMTIHGFHSIHIKIKPDVFIYISWFGALIKEVIAVKQQQHQAGNRWYMSESELSCWKIIYLLFHNISICWCCTDCSNWHKRIKGKVSVYHTHMTWSCKESGSHLNIKTIFARYGDSHVKDEMVARPSYL